MAFHMPIAAPMLGSPALRRLTRDLAGLGTVVACLQGGIFVQRSLSIPVPGSVIGMSLLLVLLYTGLVSEALLSKASSYLLLLLPALFVPIYAVPLAGRWFWTLYSPVFVPVAIAGAALTLSVAGWLAHRRIEC